MLLFEFACGDDRFRCDLLDHCALGTEAQFTKNGELLIARTFPSSTLAALWADQQRTAIEKNGA